MINKRALEKAINDTMREDFAAKMREYLIYGAPKEVNDLYRRYVDECLAAEQRRKRVFRIAGFVSAFCVWVYIIVLATGKL